MKTNALLATAALLAAAPMGNAAIVLSGDFINGTATTNTPTLTITEDIVFTMIASGSSNALVFDEWTDNDGIFGSFNARNPVNQLLSVEKNGILDMRNFAGIFNNSPHGEITKNDGLLAIATFSFVENDTITIKAGSFKFNSSTGFNPLLNGTTFSGNVYLATGSNGTRLSNIVTVPEPSALLLCGLGSLSLLRRRRA